MLTPVIFFMLLVIAVFIESVFFPYPIVFITLAIYFFFKQDVLFFILALLFAVFSDTLLLRTPPGTALFLALFLMFLYLFERIFAVLDIRVFMFLVFVGAELFRFYAGYPFDIITTGIFFIMLMTFGIFISRKQKIHV